MKSALAAVLSWCKPASVQKPRPEHLKTGKLGEKAARRALEKTGLHFLTANYRSARGEIDLVFKEIDCLVFVEVKTRAPKGWTRPAQAVDKRKRRLLSLAALDYLREIRNPKVKFRFDIVEVLADHGVVQEIRHLPNAFSLAAPHRYG